MVEVVGTLWTAIEFCYEIFVRARLINNSFFTMYKFIKHKTISHVNKYCCSFEHFSVVYMYFWVSGCPLMQQSGLSLLLFLCAAIWPPSIPCPLLFLRLESTLLWVKDLFGHTLGLLKQASLRDRSPESSEPFATLGSCVHILFICGYTRDSQSRKISELCSSFLPIPHLRASRTSRVTGSKKFVPQTRRVTRQDSVRQLSP